MSDRKRWSARVALGTLCVGAALVLLACGGGSDGGTAFSGLPAGASPPPTPPATPSPAEPQSIGTLQVRSNRADLVSGGDALVEIVPAAGVDPAALRIDVGGADVSAAFAQRADGRFMGLVGGMAEGHNLLTARLADGSASSLKITNHANGGRILYGPQIQPWGCDAGAVDADCNRPTMYSFKYVSSNTSLTGFQPYDPDHPPTDVATTTTEAGKTVPFVVRIETGVQDRDYYGIAVLFDPEQPWTPWKPQDSWNRKLVIQHGSGCGNAYQQSNALTSVRVLDSYALSRGFAVLALTLNDSGHNCNIAVQAEATMMAKEHIAEAYGELRYTFGFGSSGGAIAQQWMANAYPGLYNGIIVGASFPDAGSTLNEVEDCALLKNYFGKTATAWLPAQQAAASGHLNTAVCAEWIDVYKFNNNLNPYATNIANVPGTSPTALGGCDAPDGARYNATFNPSGVRCTAADSAISIFGKRPDGFANRAYSNVGLQYGLAALKAGTISAAQFVDLNAGIGSHTIDYELQAPRVAADPGAIEAAYRSGMVNEANGMGRVAIIDMRSLDISGIHHQHRSWTMRARLDRANGTHANQAIWYQAGTQGEAYDVMDAWLGAIERDSATTPLEQKVIAHRPANANDRCGTADGNGLTMLQCTGLADGSTRMAAGEDITGDVVECRLAPMARASYAPAVFTDTQWATLSSAFPTGVCDFAQAGKGQQPTQPWQTYLDALGKVVVGGVPLPAAP
jgi:hypothetical protein